MTLHHFDIVTEYKNRFPIKKPVDVLPVLTTTWGNNFIRHTYTSYLTINSQSEVFYCRITENPTNEMEDVQRRFNNIMSMMSSKDDRILTNELSDFDRL